MSSPPQLFLHSVIRSVSYVNPHVRRLTLELIGPVPPSPVLPAPAAPGLGSLGKTKPIPQPPSPEQVGISISAIKGAAFKPGMWVDFFVKNQGRDFVGGYSLTSSPSEFEKNGIFELCIQRERNGLDWDSFDWEKWRV
jgi:hypothetical protein